jgi:hypothetical protein
MGMMGFGPFGLIGGGGELNAGTRPRLLLLFVLDDAAHIK